MSEPNEIPADRQTLYYCGLVLTGIGLLLFLSVFFSGFSGCSTQTITNGTCMIDGKPVDCSQIPFAHTQTATVPATPSFAPALIGFVLMLAGGVMMRIGRAGLAGSGIVLDPQQAREDLKPWSHMAGGMVNDALTEVDAVKNLTDRQDSGEKIMVRCPHCKALNEENAKFCSQCGRAM